MNIVFIMTDTQCKNMVGAYGNPAVNTPNLDRLAAEGTRFERAYTVCPLCTPARASIFTGLYPQNAGPWCNNLPLGEGVATWGTIFSHYGYRCAYTGKWHLDGSGYFGDGVCPEGYEEAWWYDGKRYAEDIGKTMFEHYTSTHSTQQLNERGFTEDKIWGHQVANRAVQFLNEVGDDPFVLVASFDEPHGPFMCPAGWWDEAPLEDYPDKVNYRASTENKPQRQQRRAQDMPDISWDEYKERRRRFLGCNSYIDREIGRVLDAIDEKHRDNTLVIYTSDHGDMWGAHCQQSKGPQMYEETNNIPFIVRLPGGPSHAVSHSLISHLDILPTLLAYTGIEIPEALHGVNQLESFRDAQASQREDLMMCYNRFAINHDMMAGFYPIRCMTDGRWKLVVNLLDTDELYDLESDPEEMINRINDESSSVIRDSLHDRMIKEMNRSRDPMRAVAWAERPWRKTSCDEAYQILRRDKPAGFPFQPDGIEAR